MEPTYKPISPAVRTCVERKAYLSLNITDDMLELGPAGAPNLDREDVRLVVTAAVKRPPKCAPEKLDTESALESIQRKRDALPRTRYMTWVEVRNFALDVIRVLDGVSEG